MPVILFVGTANFCRSAYAEILLTHLLKEQSADNWSVRSAGTSPVLGQPLCAEASERLFASGIPAQELRRGARALTTTLLEDADVVLTATSEQRAEVAMLRPRAAARTFTLLEAVRLSELAPVRIGADSRVADLVDDLQAARPLAATGSGIRRSAAWRRRRSSSS